MSAPYESSEEALKAIEQLERWYCLNAPAWCEDPAGLAKLRNAVEVIKQIYQETTFPEMGIRWDTHPDNLGHSMFPGCFRCHDGKHVSSKLTTIRLECNICHLVPKVVKPGQSAPTIVLERSGEPESHRDSNWLALHRFRFDFSCITCHDVSNPGGADDSSFCSNSACHGTEWKYVGLNAPALRALIRPAEHAVTTTGTPSPIPHPVGPRTDCALCHGPGKVHPYPQDHVGMSAEKCESCHTAMLVELMKGEKAGGPSEIPHTVEGRENCILCHAVGGGVKPAPADHEGRDNEACQTCHKPPS